MTKSYAITRRFLFELVGTISLDRNDREVIDLLFVLYILKTEGILQFWERKQFSTRVPRHSSANIHQSGQDD